MGGAETGRADPGEGGMMAKAASGGRGRRAGAGEPPAEVGDNGGAPAATAPESEEVAPAEVGDKAGDDRAEFIVPEDRVEQFEKALALDAAGHDAPNLHIHGFYTQLGAELCFDPESATVADPAARPVVISALPCEDRGIPGERYELSEDQLARLQGAKERDKEIGGHSEQQAFWGEISAQLGIDRSSIGEVDDQPGVFFAIPIAPGERDQGEDDGSVIHGEEFDRRIEDMFAIADGVEINLSTLSGDIAAGMIEVLKHRPKPWGAMSQDERRNIAAACDFVAKLLARKAVQAIAAEGRASIKAKLEKQSTNKEGEITLTLKIAMPDDPTVLAVHHSLDREVLIVVADAESYMGQRKPLVPPDQDPLPFEAGTDVREPEPEHPADNSDLAAAGGPEKEPEPEEEPELEEGPYRDALIEALLDQTTLEDAEAGPIADRILEQREGEESPPPMTRKEAIARVEREVADWPAE